MDKQVIIAIGREYGSEGHEVGQKLAEKLGIQYYDRNLLDEFADKNDLDAEVLQKYDEKRKLKFGSRTVRGYSNSPIENIAEIQAALLKGKAIDEDSFVIVGRCAEETLKDFDCLVSVFICSDVDVKVKHIMEKFGVSEKEAIRKMKMFDKYRSQYHDHFCKGKWGDSKTYDLCINSSRLGVDGTVSIIYEYVQQKMNCNK